MVQLPALNTPQFSWVKSRLPRRPQPVPPIYQPEVAAEMIVWASRHRRREVLVGWPTVRAVIANKIAPGLLDRYLARTGYAAQQYDGSDDPSRPHNLWHPLPGDHGAHGDFDHRARDWSLQAWTVRHRNALLLGGTAVAGLAIAASLRRR
jgi:hypothetical protein